MPNWITNKITAPKHVIAAAVNSKGRIDFSLMSPFPGPRGADWNGISCAAEEAAEIVCRIPLDTHPLIASLQAANRSNFDIKKLSDRDFAQFIGMVENYRACGYLHSMKWAIDKWGTKWNACEPTHDLDAGTAQFDTAWACPKPVLIELSKRFPDDEISVTYADEDIGCNCGTFTLKAGVSTASDIAPQWDSMTDEQKTKWRFFAYQVKGYSAESITKAKMSEDEMLCNSAALVKLETQAKQIFALTGEVANKAEYAANMYRMNEAQAKHIEQLNDKLNDRIVIADNWKAKAERLESTEARYRDLLERLGVQGHAGAVAEIKQLRAATLAKLAAIELPLIGPHDHPEPETLMWSKTELAAIEEYRRQAFAQGTASRSALQKISTERLPPDMQKILHDNLRELYESA